MSVQGQNPDLTLGNQRPGVYVAVNLDAPGGGIGDIQRRMLIAAYKQASGTAAQDSPFQPLGQSDADAGCGAKSDAARGYRAVAAQVGAGDIDIYILPLIAPAGGTASTYKLIFGFTGVATAAAAPGSVDVMIDGRSILTVGFSTGDTGPIIAAAVKAAIDLLPDAPCVASITSATITLTYPHKGAVGEDLPIRVNVNESTPGATAVTVSPGSLLYATSATGAGSATLTVGATTITAPLAGGETAAQVAALMVAAISSGNYPVTAVVDSGTPAQADLFYAPKRTVRRYSAAIVTSTGTTVDASSGGAVGSGTPSLTAALANLGNLPGFKGWAVPFVGTQASPDTTTLGTIASFVELRANGVNQQEQSVHACSTGSLTQFGTIPIGTSPALTASPRYAMMWAKEFGVQGWEIACRLAAARVNNDYAAKNWDGFGLLSNFAAPLILPDSPARASSDEINLAMRTYYLTPIRVNDGTNTAVVEKGTTTSNSTYMPLRDFATIDQIGFWRVSLAQRLVDKFRAVSAKKYSPPKTPNTITQESVGEEAYLLALEWDDADLYDGAETFKSGFKSKFNAQSPTRIDLSFPMSPVRNVHQIGAIGNLVSA